jgi:hypothetical protein
MEVIYQKSLDEFSSARFRSLLNNLKFFLIGRDNELLSFDKIRKELELKNQRYLGIQTVSIDNIVGSFDRYRDFDKFFLPRKPHLQRRWANIHNAIARDIILPPVQLYKIGEIYFVLDGNHRISVSKKMGIKYVDADVTEFTTNLTITPDMDPKDIFILAEREKFLKITNLSKNKPDLKIRITIPGQYDFLLRQIHKLMVQLNENKKVDEKLLTFEEASQIWYEKIYLPAIEIIKNYGILDNFPNRTKTDLYVWINEHKRYLSLKYGREVVIKFAAKDFSMRYSEKFWIRLKLKLTYLKYRLINKFKKIGPSFK